MVKTGPGRTTSTWQRLKAETLAWSALHRRPCYLCRRPIDYALTAAQPNHGQAATVHHVVGLEQGGAPEDPANLAVAHRGCNTRHSNRLRGLASARRKSLAALVTGSRRW